MYKKFPQCQYTFVASEIQIDIRVLVVFIIFKQINNLKNQQDDK
jgi:hypothetical protein